MADVGRRAKLTFEPVQLGPVHLGQHFQSHPVAPQHVDRLEDDPHAAPPQLADQPIVAEPSGRKGLGAGGRDVRVAPEARPGRS